VAGFIDATKVAQEADPFSFVAQLDPQWTVFDRPHGGYLVAIAARAAGLALAEAGHVDPLAVSAHFLSSPVAGEASVRLTPLRTGRTVSQVRAALSQAGVTCVEALLTMGRLTPAAEPYWTGESPVALPAPAECVPAPNPDARLAMYEVVDLRLDPANLGYLRGKPDGSGELRGWLSFADDTPPDPLNLLYVADALPPASLTINPSGWVPTLELSVYVRARPAPGPLRVRQRARLIETVAAATGMMDEVCDVWDSRNRLVAQATQLASVRFAR
jgi:acyl-coenzyme A thioesterase PaaI-like protein